MRSDAVWVYKWGTLSLPSPCEGKDCIHWWGSLRCSIGMQSSTLPLTSPCSGTKRKTTVPLFFASTGGLRLLSFIPILLLSLHRIGFYSPSLRRVAITESLDFSLQTHTASVASLDWFLQSFTSPDFASIGLRLLSSMPILQSLHQINFYSSSLRWSFASIGLRLALIQTYIAENSSLFYFLQHPFKRSYWSGLLIFIRFLIKWIPFYF